jgi:hypothetical protein
VLDARQHFRALWDSADHHSEGEATSTSALGGRWPRSPENRGPSSKKKSTEEELRSPQIMLERCGASRLPRTPEAKGNSAAPESTRARRGQARTRAARSKATQGRPSEQWERTLTSTGNEIVILTFWLLVAQLRQNRLLVGIWSPREAASPPVRCTWAVRWRLAPPAPSAKSAPESAF